MEIRLPNNGNGKTKSNINEKIHTAFRVQSFARFARLIIFPISVILYSDERTEGMIMKKYQMVRKLKLTDFEIRVAIDALAVYRKKQIEENIEHDSTNELLLRFLDLLEE